MAEYMKKDCVHYGDCDFQSMVGCPSFCVQYKHKDDVRVVRCKDCKHYRNHPNGLCDCWTEPYANERGYKGDMHCVEPDDFCSYGERKEEK